jgi:hypothetical protein
MTIKVREREQTTPLCEKIRTVCTLAEGRSMAYILEMPVAGGGMLRVQGAEEDVPAGLEPAARRMRGSGTLVVRTKESVQAAIDEIQPAIVATAARLRAITADELTVEFGLLLGAEGGAIVAKGKGEVHFTVTLTWRGSRAEEPDANA